MYCKPINKKGCKTFEDHVRRLVDIFFECGNLQVLEMETIKICKENNFDIYEMVKHVQWMIEDLK
ncbi:hypothetical protein M3Y14_04090 [Bacillus thuringiensis]|uniref:hypothetical protein n=1 Tax=Bacillus thuringiensis TaxID=1428 RepID=UPI002224FE8B|nr:hypothetical protein [Bacillus thuringiensis]UYX53343.1 hypothetical protein M3Y14_04090 [Bacillus thuringiensis]